MKLKFWKLFLKLVILFFVFAGCFYTPKLIEDLFWDTTWRISIFLIAIFAILFAEPLYKYFSRKELTVKEWEEQVAEPDELQRRIKQGFDYNGKYFTARGYNFGLYLIRPYFFALAVAWRDGTIEFGRKINIHRNAKQIEFSPPFPINQLQRVFGKDSVVQILEEKLGEKIESEKVVEVKTE